MCEGTGEKGGWGEKERGGRNKGEGKKGSGEGRGEGVRGQKEGEEKGVKESEGKEGEE